MQCTGAAKLGVFKWKITRRGPVIAVVLAVSRRARAQSRSDGARHRNRNQP
jgi:hypothetical protein